MDVVDKVTRSRMMAGIRGKDTRPELLLRSALHKKAFRFRLHDKRLPGRPDIVLPKYNAVIFVDGCFWHRHKGCKYTTTPKTRIEFWKKKFKESTSRDQRNHAELLEAGWRVAVVWECAIKKWPAECVAQKVSRWLEGEQQTLEIG